jgi:cytochrome P450
LETVITADQLTTREVIADPYPAYRQLREQSPFNYIFVPAESRPGLKEPIRAWAFMKHDDVYGALRDHETFSSVRPAKWAQMFPGLVLIEDDPPRHTRFRRLVNKAFTVRRIEELTPWITAVANELLDRLGAGENDMVPAYAVPLPVRELLACSESQARITRPSSAGATPFYRLSRPSRRRTYRTSGR